MIVIVAGVGRCPFAQVLRNSLSGHPPTTGDETNTANPKQHLISWIQPPTGHGTFSKTEYHGVAQQPRPRQFRTTWRAVK